MFYYVSEVSTEEHLQYPNLGMFGIDAFDEIISPNHVGINVKLVFPFSFSVLI